MIEKQIKNMTEDNIRECSHTKFEIIGFRKDDKECIWKYQPDDYNCSYCNGPCVKEEYVFTLECHDCGKTIECDEKLLAQHIQNGKV